MYILQLRQHHRSIGSVPPVRRNHFGSPERGIAYRARARGPADDRRANSPVHHHSRARSPNMDPQSRTEELAEAGRLMHLPIRPPRAEASAESWSAITDARVQCLQTALGSFRRRVSASTARIAGDFKACQHERPGGASTIGVLFRTLAGQDNSQWARGRSTTCQLFDACDHS